jgi:hypothetical protein
VTKVRNEKQDVVKKPPRSARPSIYTREAVECFMARLVGEQEDELLEALAREHHQELLQRMLRRKNAKKSGAAA